MSKYQALFDLYKSVGKKIPWTEQELLGGLGGTAVGAGALMAPGESEAGVTPLIAGAKSVIRDWRWRPIAEVKAELGLNDIPEHVIDYGRFMQEQVGKAQGEGLTPRDLVKAYAITQSSIQRQAVDAGLVDEAFRGVVGEGKVRPEDVFSSWLMSPKGKQYLDSAEKGTVDEESLADAARVIRPFGKDKSLEDSLRWGATNFAGREGPITQAVIGGMSPKYSVNDWLENLGDVPGIAHAKAGFMGSLLGYGRLPTMDARQLLLHTGRPTAEASKYLRRQGGLGGTQALMRLAGRQEDLGLNIPPDLEPFRQALTHNTVWDATSGTVTPHTSVRQAMTTAGLGAAALGLGSLMAPGEAEAGFGGVLAKTADLPMLHPQDTQDVPYAQQIILGADVSPYASLNALKRAAQDRMREHRPLPPAAGLATIKELVNPINFIPSAAGQLLTWPRELGRPEDLQFLDGRWLTPRQAAAYGG
jgi:hypothetical protein